MTAENRQKIPVPRRSFLWSLNETSGEILTHVGPTEFTPSANDRIVRANATGGFEQAPMEARPFVVARDGEYRAPVEPRERRRHGGRAKNGSCHRRRQQGEGARSSVRRRSFLVRARSRSGPASRAEVRPAHKLGANQYLLVEVVGEVDEKRAPTTARDRVGGPLVRVIDQCDDDAAHATEAAPRGDGQPLRLGQRIVIQGRHTQLFIPPSGIEIVPPIEEDRVATRRRRRRWRREPRAEGRGRVRQAGHARSRGFDLETVQHAQERAPPSPGSRDRRARDHALRARCSVRGAPVDASWPAALRAPLRPARSVRASRRRPRSEGVLHPVRRRRQPAHRSRSRARLPWSARHVPAARLAPSRLRRVRARRAPGALAARHHADHARTGSSNTCPAWRSIARSTTRAPSSSCGAAPPSSSRSSRRRSSTRRRASRTSATITTPSSSRRSASIRSRASTSATSAPAW